MANVTIDGRDLGDITDPAELAYYRREPGAVVDGVPTPAAAASTATPTVDDVTVEGNEDPAPERPAKSASKQEWYDYAKQINPDIAAYDDITAVELVEQYGAE